MGRTSLLNVTAVGGACDCASPGAAPASIRAVTAQTGKRVREFMYNSCNCRRMTRDRSMPRRESGACSRHDLDNLRHGGTLAARPNQERADLVQTGRQVRILKDR